jgi:pimeloyl-ACP methyl ester carboxylesterase
MPLQGGHLELHLSTPSHATADGVLVLYASGDGGWFGAARDMFHRIATAGYYTVGFSSRAFLKLERPRGPLVSAAQLANDYKDILAHARRDLGLPETTPAVLAGWSRGAAFAVLTAGESHDTSTIAGVIAIGLSDGEDLQINGAEDETDEGQRTAETKRWPFAPYKEIAHLVQPCAVIQATHDNYFPARDARALFGPDTASRRFYTIDAKNHRFSGGKDAFDSALVDALGWIVRQSPSPSATH